MSVESDKAIKKLKLIRSMDNQEIASKEADEVLCHLLNVIGYRDVIKQYRLIKPGGAV